MIKKIFLKIMKKYQRILFVGSTDILPEPLTKEEEIKYVEMSMNNDEFARNKLIEHNKFNRYRGMKNDFSTDKF